MARSRTDGRSSVGPDERSLQEAGLEAAGLDGAGALPSVSSDESLDSPADRRLRRFPWAWLIVAVGGIAGLLPMNDNSFLTHVATGRIILDSGVPSADPYTFTAHGEPWVVQSWGASWLYAVAERVGGMELVRLLVAAWFVAATVLVWNLAAPARRLVGRLVVVFAVLGVGLEAWSERPQQLAIVLLAMALLAWRERWPLWSIGVIFAVWVNVHGSFPLGGALLVAAMVGRWLDERRVERRDLQLVAVAAGSGVLAAVVSPVGWHLLSFPFSLMSRRSSLQLIVEWQRPAADSISLWLVVGLWLAVAAGSWQRRQLRSVPMLVLSPALVWMGQRNLPIVAIGLAAVGAATLAEFGALDAPLPVDRRVARRLAVAAGTVVLILAVALPPMNLKGYPVDAANWMERNGLRPSPSMTVLSTDYMGNYLEFRFGPTGGVFADDRAEVIPFERIEDVATMLDDDPSWKRRLNESGADLLLWPVDNDVADGVDLLDGWRLVYRDTKAVVACRLATVHECPERPPSSGAD